VAPTLEYAFPPVESAEVSRELTSGTGKELNKDTTRGGPQAKMLGGSALNGKIEVLRSFRQKYY